MAGRGEHGGAARRVTIADVAREAGVSPGAVSFALNNRPGVADATRRRVLDAAAELGWRPNHRARALSHQSSFTLGLVVARPTTTVGADPFFPAFVAGVTAALQPSEQSLTFTVVPDHDAEIETYRRFAAEKRVDGVFLTDLRVHDPRPALMAELGLPAVTLGRPDRTSSAGRVGAVSVDDSAGMREVVRTLVDAGHHRIAHVTGPAEFLHVRSRREAWEATLTAAGLAADLLVHTDFSAGEGAGATDRLLSRRVPPTAITYANDVMAMAGLAVAQRRGLAVPTDLSITGFDDVELAHYANPPLTTVRTDVAGWGTAAAHALLAAVADATARDVDLPPARMIARASVAPPTPARPRKGTS
ncbi:transcriptional regulator, LacI family [Jatrophihabitans endophyticus]|uniref:Transcriptional regulator, LacI family n=1 Tax=Jatrophihabitans endophyticus TaxID=1206085 RepID=A0A1M5HKN9_9ACTN|nr:LacI family DNA-binding transcriptional regulator [Jatrophihabitans endophyticus]SHG16526.1 transcriptional regulator, LacI family [Jatrophihabitans endophyticus]